MRARLFTLSMQSVVALLAMALALPAAAQNFYVSTTGAPGAAGSCDAPVDTVAEALDLARAFGGPTQVRIAMGTYNEASLVIDFSDVSVKGGYDPATLGGGCSDGAAEAARDSGAFPTAIDAGQADRIFDVLPNIDDTDPDNPVFLSVNQNIVIDGLILENGLPQRDLDFDGDGVPDDTGGGAGAALILNCNNVTLSNNLIRDNESKQHGFVGGAVYFAMYATDIGEFHPGTMQLVNNLFENNSTGNGSTASGWGGAFAARDFNSDGMSVARGTVVNAQGNTFRGNTSQGSANLAAQGLCTPNQDCNPVDGAADTCGVQALGGAVYLNNVSGVWAGNLFEDNQARPVPSLRFDQTGWGGAMASLSSGGAMTGGASPTIVENTFIDNFARTGVGDLNDCGWFSGWGGALFLIAYDDDVIGNIFQGNQAESTLQNRAPFSARGGGVFLSPTGTLSGGQLPRVQNNVFEGNEAVSGASWVGGWGGGLHINDQFGTGGDPVITNNVFRGNRAYTDGSYYRSAYGGGLQFTATGNYPLVARNLFEENRAERNNGLAGAIAALGGAAHFRIQRDDGVVAENQVRNNYADALDQTGPASPGTRTLLAFGGFVFGMTPFDDAGDTRGPLVMNNLIVDNQGVGLSVQGLWADGLAPDDPGGGDDEADPEELFFHGPSLLNNTIANNEGVGLITNLFDEGVLDSNVIWGNDGGGATFGNWFDNWLCSDGDGTDDCIDRPSLIATVRNNVFQDFPMNQTAAVVDPMSMAPINGNKVAEDPLFIDGTNPDITMRNYRLQQPPDQPATSSALDAGPIGAIARDFATPRNLNGRDVDGDGDPANDNMFNRTTNDPSSRPDVFFVDAGYHYPLDPSMPIVDTDGDGVPDDVEISLAMNDPRFACLDPNDADSDDDGVPDGLDVGDDIDGDGSVAACDCDADGDGLTDGREQNILTPDGDTDLGATCDTSNAPLGCGDAMQASFDMGTGTQTDPLNPDSDGGGEYDGCESLDYGCIPSTRDPNDGADDDPDRDCLNTDLEESFSFTDPLDADTDDDGIADGQEGMPMDFNDFTDPLVCDTDADFLPDGLERGVTMPVPDPDGPDFPGTGTDLAATCDTDGDGMADGPSYVAASPADPNYRDTYAAVDIFVGGMPGVGRDSDGDGCLDGIEDYNRNGIYEPDGTDGIPGTDDDETDPLAPDCAGSANLLINGSITALTGGGGDCGLATMPPLDGLLDAAGACTPIIDPQDYQTNCPSPRSDTAEGGSVQVSWSGMVVRAGEAAPGSFDGANDTGIVLVLYEVDNCDQTIRVYKQGLDLVVEGM